MTASPTLITPALTTRTHTRDQPGLTLDVGALDAEEVDEGASGVAGRSGYQDHLLHFAVCRPFFNVQLSRESFNSYGPE